MGDWGRGGYNSDGNSSGEGGGWGGGRYSWEKDHSSPSSDGRGRYYGKRSSSSSSSNKDAYATYTKDDGVSLKNEDGWGFDDDDRSDKDNRSSGSSDGKTFDIFKHSLEWNDGEKEFQDEEVHYSVDSDLDKDNYKSRRKSSSDSDRRRKDSTSSSERDKSDKEWRKSRSEQYYPDVVKLSSNDNNWCCCIVI